MVRSTGDPTTRASVTITSVILVLAALYFARAVLVPLSLSILLAFILSPLVSWLERCRVARGPAVILVSALFVAGTGVLAWTVGHQLYQVALDLPNYKDNIEKKIQVIRHVNDGALDRATGTISELQKDLATPASSSPVKSTPGLEPSTKAAPRPVPVIIESPRDLFPMLFSILGPVMGPIGMGVMVVVFAVFILLAREKLRNRLLRLAGRSYLSKTTQALDEAATRVSRYLLIQSAVNVGYGTLVAIGLHFAGVPNALLWGVLAGLLRYVPYIGTLIGAALPTLLALGAFEDWKRPLLVLGLFILIEIVVAYIVEPFLYASQTGISSLAVLVSAVFWTSLWGPVGLLLSTPLTVCLVAFGKYVPHLEFVTILLGDQSVLSPEVKIYQRLLAADPEESREVAEEYLEGHSLLELYESVLVPVLILAEQDRRRAELDECRQRFLFQNLREIIEDLGQQYAPPASASEEQEHSKARLRGTERKEPERIIALPARDEGDELVGLMLEQLAARSGSQIETLPAGSPDELVHQIGKLQPVVMCISALPPVAIVQARSVYRRIKRQNADARIVIGLWKFSGETSKAEERLGVSKTDRVITSLSDALELINASQEPAFQNA